jgi:hypothetical protein
LVDFDQLAAEQYCYLTTTGRVTGRPHEIEIWFGMKTFRREPSASGTGRASTTVYMLSGGRERSDWVRNLTKKPSVTVRIGRRRFDGLARAVQPGTEEDGEARGLLLDKYRKNGDDLSEWGRNALPVAIELNISGIVAAVAGS